MKNYVFIDSQNLNLAIRDCGWKLDFKKFHVYLKEKYKINKAFIFIGYVYNNKKLYKFLEEAGYILIFKPITMDVNRKIKGNIDAELVLHSMIEYPNYDKAIIVSGDGDFYCLIEYLRDKGKLLNIIIPNQNKYSKLLRGFNPDAVFLNALKSKLK